MHGVDSRVGHASLAGGFERKIPKSDGNDSAKGATGSEARPEIKGDHGERSHGSWRIIGEKII